MNLLSKVLLLISNNQPFISLTSEANDVCRILLPCKENIIDDLHLTVLDANQILSSVRV